MKHPVLLPFLALLLLDGGKQMAPAPSPPQRSRKAIAIKWDASTLVRVHGGTYGRMIRLRDGGILCGFEAGGKSWTTRSRDNGKTWRAPLLAAAIPYAAAANPELLPLKSGRILLFFNQRPRDGIHPFAIGCSTSDDNGATWRQRDTLIFEAGTDAKNGCWEPAAIQLPSGEIQLFFANEFPYPNSDEQQITLMRSLDNGATWSRPEVVAFRAGHRDGMPVPLLLRDPRGRIKSIICSIEDNGLVPGALLQPAIISTPLGKSWRQPVVGGSSPQRWGAVTPPLAANIYAGAPYIRQLPSGETLLSCQSQEGGRDKPQMVVYIGDGEARRFGRKSVPIPLPGNVGGWWNSLFVKDADTITALTDTTINGQSGVWAIDGRVVREGDT